MYPIHDLEGRVAPVTGAGSGMGLAAAETFAEAGAAVVRADFRQDSAKATAQRLAAAGRLAIAVAEFGRLDAALNDAGGMVRIVPTAENSREECDRVIGVNLRGVWSCMTAELRQMARQGSGAIVNNAPVGAVTGNSGLGVYIASQHGVIGLTRTAGHERRA